MNFKYYLLPRRKILQKLELELEIILISSFLVTFFYRYGIYHIIYIKNNCVIII